MKNPTATWTVWLSLGFFFTLLSAQAGPLPPVSHTSWNALLKAHVSASGQVNYAGMKQDVAKLDAYLAQLQKQAPTKDWSRNEKLAYWINTYNAFTVKLILTHYPLKSIRDIDKPWDQKFIQIGDQTLSLNDIEHNIIRKRFNEPRIHFAVNCAAQSCPRLRNEAYTAGKLSQQLAEQTRSFINNRAFNQLDAQQPKVSKLFEWYAVDFKQNGTVIDYINQYADTKIGATASLSFLTYNWSLNGK